jgi:myo-inositol catabolism protein IolC
LTRVSGSPGTRAFIIGSTIGADFASKFLNNTINDPNYVKSHVDS